MLLVKRLVEVRTPSPHIVAWRQGLLHSDKWFYPEQPWPSHMPTSKWAFKLYGLIWPLLQLSWWHFWHPNMVPGTGVAPGHHGIWTRRGLSSLDCVIPLPSLFFIYAIIFGHTQYRLCQPGDSRLNPVSVVLNRFAFCPSALVTDGRGN